MCRAGASIFCVALRTFWLAYESHRRTTLFCGGFSVVAGPFDAFLILALSGYNKCVEPSGAPQGGSKKSNAVIILSLTASAVLVAGLVFFAVKYPGTRPSAPNQPPASDASSTSTPVEQLPYSPDAQLQILLANSFLGLPPVTSIREGADVPSGLGFLILPGAKDLHVGEVAFVGGEKGVNVAYRVAGAVSEIHQRFTDLVRENGYPQGLNLWNDTVGLTETQNDRYKIQIREEIAEGGVSLDIYIVGRGDPKNG
jgi:hypothetical protein